MSQPTMLSSELQLAIAPGPLGIGIYRNEADGSCVVSKTTTQQSPFEVGDIILRLNGVSLRGVEGGVQGWVALFQRYANLQRNVVVRRWAPASGATVAATAVPASSDAPTNGNKAMTTSSSSGAPSSAPIVAPQQNTVSTTHHVTANVNQQPTEARAPSVPKTQQVANNNNMIHRETVTVFKPTQQSKLGIGLVGTAGCIKVLSIAPGGLFSTTRLKVGMIVESINNVQCSDAAHGVRLLKAAERQVTIVARHTEKTKKALKPSTYQNAKKRKAEVSKPKKAANKKQAVSKTKTAAVPKARPVAVVAKPKKSSSSSKHDFNHDDAYMHLLENGFPDPGCVSACQNYYVTKNNDTYKSIAEKLGMEDWRQLSKMPFNDRFYGQAGKTKHKTCVLFAARTVIKIPKTAASKWKLNKIVDNYQEEVQAMATCSKCLKKELPNDPDEMLMCDGCDLEMHVSCAGLTAVPTFDWLCPGCLEIMDARRTYLAEGEETRSLEARLPKLPALSADTLDLAARAQQRFITDITARKENALEQVVDNQRVLAIESKERIEELKDEISDAREDEVLQLQSYYTATRLIRERMKLVDWKISENFGMSFIKYRKDDGNTVVIRRTMSYGYSRGRYDSSYSYEGGTQNQWQTWYNKLLQYTQETRALPECVEKNAAKEKVTSLEEELESAEENERERPDMDQDDRRSLLLSFATLLSEPQLNFETAKEYGARMGQGPLFLGVVKTRDSSDVQVLNILKEPTELVIIVPVNPSVDGDVTAVETGLEYYLWGAAELFCSDRNDCLPMDFSPTSVRSAQKDLIAMLLRDPRNSSVQVSAPSVPSSVCLRGSGTDEMLGQMTKCFDLSELVRDCNYPIQDQPLLETPKRLADNGLELRNYQKTSLKWLVDKETNPTGMGSSGELWHRMRGLGGNGQQDFFFCDLTGSMLSDIFDYRSDVDQKDASKYCGDSFPSSAIVGSEMGLGKTVIALSLIVASPPSLQNRTLPREYISKINHPAYIPPPYVTGSLSTNAKGFLSSGTLVIAPMTLCPQWQAEIERFAPWMSFLTLHNDEKATIDEIASKDLVVISTFLLSSSGRRSTGNLGSSQLMNKLKRVHFHRIILDESHYNNTGDRVKSALSQLSSTHRYAVTGTPVGHSLADLYGQLRFLRVPQFCRPDFWKQCIDTPYSNHNYYALNVLRSLLSRTVIRHSKEQNLDGKALVSLPPRTVETLLLQFGSKEEKIVYDYLETKNTARFMSLRSESPHSVLGKFIELNGMLFASRHACGHASLVNLDNVHNLNEKIESERLEKLRKANKGKKKEPETKKLNLTRADILQQAITKARPSASNRMREAVMSIQEGEIEYVECPICLDPIEEQDIALTPCAHKFCGECIRSCLESLSSSREPRGNCPECRELIKLTELTFLGDAKDAGEKVAKNDDDQKPKAKEEKSEAIDINGFNLLTKDIFSSTTGASDQRALAEILDNKEKMQQRACCHTIPGDVLEAWNIASAQIGSKVARLLEEIKCMSQNDATSKCVVFSQFLGTLDIVQQELTARGVKFSRVDGNMKQYQRADNIHSFTNESEVKVLLLSMRAGAAGLNLMAANYCFLMDPATNSAIEEQAIDRIHRIGQTRPVTVKRFIMEGTVEQRVLENRRSLAADQPTASALLDGSGDLEEEEKLNNIVYMRERHVDENNMGEKSFQRLRQLEALFGCEATVKVTRA